MTIRQFVKRDAAYGAWPLLNVDDLFSWNPTACDMSRAQTLDSIKRYARYHQEIIVCFWACLSDGADAQPESERERRGREVERGLRCALQRLSGLNEIGVDGT